MRSQRTKAAIKLVSIFPQKNILCTHSMANRLSLVENWPRALFHWSLSAMQHFGCFVFRVQLAWTAVDRHGRNRYVLRSERWSEQMCQFYPEAANGSDKTTISCGLQVHHNFPLVRLHQRAMQRSKNDTRNVLRFTVGQIKAFCCFFFFFFLLLANCWPSRRTNYFWSIIIRQEFVILSVAHATCALSLSLYPSLFSFACLCFSSCILFFVSFLVLVSICILHHANLLYIHNCSWRRCDLLFCPLSAVHLANMHSLHWLVVTWFSLSGCGCVRNVPIAAPGITAGYEIFVHWV